MFSRNGQWPILPFLVGGWKKCRRPKVFFHVGPHKTGTTSIQKVLSGSDDRLRYPVPTKRGPGHSHLAFQLMTKRVGHGNPLTETIVREGWLDGEKPVVFSSEDFSRAARLPQAAARICELTEFARTELIVTHRSVLDRLHSRIQERVKHGIIEEFDGERFVLGHIPGNGGFHEFRDDFFDRLLALGRWKRCHVVMVDPGSPCFLVDSFSDILGVALSADPVPLLSNMRIPFGQMRILHGLHRDNPTLDMHVLLESSRVRFDALQRSDPTKSDEPYPMIPDEERRRFEALDAALSRRIRELERKGRLVVHRSHSS